MNKGHLFLGTLADNNIDRARKGRSADNRGERHACVKLTEAQVKEIRERYKRGNGVLLAAEYGVTKFAISDIVLRKNWRHIA